MKKLFVIGALLFATPAFAQTTREEKGWIDVNFGVAASAAGDATYVYTFEVFQETGALSAAYGKPSQGAEFDFGGGYMFTSKVGLGLNFAGTAHEDIAGLGAGLPHPYFFDETAIVGAQTDEKLTRTEGSANIHAMIVPLHSDRLRIRFFGGPTVFRYKAEMVQDLFTDQFATPFSRANVVSIDRYLSQDAEGNGFGFNVGGDVSVFFSRVFGLGAFARYNRGTVEIFEPLSEETPTLLWAGFSRVAVSGCGSEPGMQLN